MHRRNSGFKFGGAIIIFMLVLCVCSLRYIKVETGRGYIQTIWEGEGCVNDFEGA